MHATSRPYPLRHASRPNSEVGKQRNDKDINEEDARENRKGRSDQGGGGASNMLPDWNVQVGRSAKRKVRPERRTLRFFDIKLF